ncbi:MAG: queuosine precursor transporter [Opitutales bacterium]|nr:queuosine precursor transporter [Opitutales bacterium]
MYTNELLWFAMLVVNFSCILLFYRFFGRVGLYLWIPISAIVANLQVIKLVTLFGVEATLGNIVYASSFLVTDILSENYGKKDARKAVLIGFCSLISMVVLMQMALVFIPSENDFVQESLEQIFGLMPRLMVASFCAYFLSQFHDVWMYHLLKKQAAEGRGLWLRNTVSTSISQAIDSSVFTVIAFWGVFESSLLWEIFLTTYFLKFVVAVLDTPFIYIARYLGQTEAVKRLDSLV